MGATLVWPAVTVLGFFLVSAVVVVLGASSTARYEFERNGARAPQRSTAGSRGVHPAGRRASAMPPGAGGTQAQPGAVGVAVRPPAATGDPAWWLVDGSSRVVTGPFADRFDADWAALADGLAAVAVFGVRRADGAVTRRPSPQDRVWFGQLGRQLDRLPEDWDDVLSDTDPLTTLVVEVVAALAEAGLPLYDAAAEEPGGGVSLVPELAAGGVLVSWRAHDRMTAHGGRGPAAGDAVQELMNATLDGLLERLGFLVQPYGATGCSLVTALR